MACCFLKINVIDQFRETGALRQFSSQLERVEEQTKLSSQAEFMKLHRSTLGIAGLILPTSTVSLSASKSTIVRAHHFACAVISTLYHTAILLGHLRCLLWASIDDVANKQMGFLQHRSVLPRQNVAIQFQSGHLASGGTGAATPQSASEESVV